MRLYLFLIWLLVVSLPGFAQNQIKAVIADSITHNPLPFATVKTGGKQKAIITHINGQFAFSPGPETKMIEVSYVSYNTKQFAVSSLKDHDTLFLSPAISTLSEVIVKPQRDKIRRIINLAVQNKSNNNPDFFERYRCNMYYKWKVDLLPSVLAIRDSARLRAENELRKEKYKKDAKPDTSVKNTSIHLGDNHMIFSETYSKRLYKRPQQLQEIVIASRLSGLKKTYFTSLITDFLPFHIYGDYLPLGAIEYINPISKGWQQRYEFKLADEIVNDNDTTFLFSFNPKKNLGFNSLKGMVYINSDGWAISHFISSTADTSKKREFRIEQVSEKVDGRWFPKELNYDLIYDEYISPLFKFQINGHSVIDSVSFSPGTSFKIEKAYTIRIGDSVDLHSDQDWSHLRPEPLTVKEKNTYRVLDSLSQKYKLEKYMPAIGRLGIGRLPYKKIEIDINRLFASNNYEGKRLGLGIYTNDIVSTYYSIGGWAGYGFRDGKIKWGASATVFPIANKDNWLHLFYNDDLQNAGNIHIHPEIDRNGYRTWLLTSPDRVREYGITNHFRKDYMEIEIDLRRQNLNSLYENNFTVSGKQYKEFDVNEASIGLRYAYGEKRAPAFGYYIPFSTKYPIIYFRGAYGTIKSGSIYSTEYLRALVAVDFKKHLNRWGNDIFRLEAGLIHSFNKTALSQSFLPAAKGFKRDEERKISFYAWGGFLTMLPHEFFSDRYVSFLYKHDFDKFLWKTKNSKPFISLGHNMMYGGLSNQNKIATVGIKTLASGYYESGLMLNQLLKVNAFRAVYLNLNSGVYYHWKGSLDWRENGVFVVGFSMGF